MESSSLPPHPSQIPRFAPPAETNILNFIAVSSRNFPHIFNQEHTYILYVVCMLILYFLKGFKTLIPPKHASLHHAVNFQNKYNTIIIQLLAKSIVYYFYHIDINCIHNCSLWCTIFTFLFLNNLLFFLELMTISSFYLPTLYVSPQLYLQTLTEMKKNLNHILIHDIIYDFYTLAPHLGNTFPRFPHLPNPIRFGSFLHLYSAVILEILFPHWGRALASWILVSFFTVPHQNEESIPVASGERVHAMKFLLHLFILATYKI